MADTSQKRPGASKSQLSVSDTSEHTAPGRPKTPRILCVDDDVQLLSGLRRVLCFDFDIVTEIDPVAALRRLETEADFEVVLSDLEMPQLSGAQFLAQTRRILPSATRVLLTGVPNLAAAIACINEGGVFRFLTKPCENAELLSALHEAVRLCRTPQAIEPAPQVQLAPRQDAGDITYLQRPWQQGSSRQRPALPAALLQPATAPLVTPPTASQLRRAQSRLGSHLSALAGNAQAALEEGRGQDAERLLVAPLRALLQDACQANRPMR